MSATLPNCPTLLLDLAFGVLRVTINRPNTRNALTDEVVRDMCELTDVLEKSGDIRAVVLRGSDGTFCAGGDIKGFQVLGSVAGLPADAADPFITSNLAFGELLLRWNALPQVTIALVEGAAFGGGVGLVCAVDMALATHETRFAVSETRLGIIPAQIAPFLVTRVGLGAARHVALTGRGFDGIYAKSIGLISDVYEDGAAIDAACDALLGDILRCAPSAVAATKALLLRVGNEPIAPLMRHAANLFVAAARGPEGREGVAAFLEKRSPMWSVRASSASWATPG